jgi:hypothetical protein
MATLAALSAAQQTDPWLLPNFAQRLELEVSNPSSSPVDTLAVIPVPEAAQIALRFPGTLAIAVMPGPAVKILPTQADDLDGDGSPDEFVFPVRLEARETRTVHVYYSTTLRDSIPWPKRVHASHAFGYNRATVALESERIGYRTYGGFFLDIQARRESKPGLHNTLVGYFGSSNPSEIGQDIIHLGDTLGLGGIFLRDGNNVHRPPLNMPDYAHKPSPPVVPEYRVIADGPLRALVEARMKHWKIGSDEADVRALYSIAAGSEHVECRFRILPVQVSKPYQAGAGIRHLPQIKLDHAAGRLALSGIQSAKIGALSLALYFDPAEADAREALMTKDGGNECIVFRQRLEPGHAAEGRYWLAAAWSGAGIKDLLAHVAAIEKQARASVTVGKYRFTRTPNPQRIEGEAN